MKLRINGKTYAINYQAQKELNIFINWYLDKIIYQKRQVWGAEVQALVTKKINYYYEKCQEKNIPDEVINAIMEYCDKEKPLWNDDVYSHFEKF